MFYVQLLFDVFASIVSPQVQNIDTSVFTAFSSETKTVRSQVVKAGLDAF